MSQLTSIREAINAHKNNTPELPTLNRFTGEQGTDKNRSFAYTHPVLRNDNYEGTPIASVGYTFDYRGDTYRAEVWVHVVDYRDFDAQKNRARLSYEVSELARFGNSPKHYGYSPQIRDGLRKALARALDALIGIDSPDDNYTRTIKLTRGEVVDMIVQRMIERAERVTTRSDATQYANMVRYELESVLRDCTRYRNGTNVYGVTLTEQNTKAAMNRTRAYLKKQLRAQAQAL